MVQDYLLPTLAYVGGAAEIAYFGQGAVVYKALLGRATPILPRFSATIVEAKPQSLLERYGMTVPDTFQGPEALRETLAAHSFPADLQAAFDQAESSLKQSLGFNPEIAGTSGQDSGGSRGQCRIKNAAPDRAVAFASRTGRTAPERDFRTTRRGA